MNIIQLIEPAMRSSPESLVPKKEKKGGEEKKQTNKTFNIRKGLSSQKQTKTEDSARFN